MNPKDKVRWERARSKGFVHFLLMTGILKFGGVVFLLDILTNNVLYRKWAFEDILETAILSCAGGLAFGIIIWVLQELRYARSV